MTAMQPKSRAGTSWLPNQVAYGMDCSDVDPSKWTTFGYAVDQVATAEAKAALKNPPSTGQPKQ